METRLNRNDLSWIGRAGCIFFHKGFVVRSVRAYDRPAPRLAKESAKPSLPTELNRSG